MGKVISVLSGKGGVGKTFFTANVAAALSMLHCKVLTVDYDIGLRNLDLALGMQDSSPFDFSDYLNGNAELDKIISEHPGHKGLCFMAGPQYLDPAELPDDALSDIIEKVRDDFDYILIDCSAGIGKSLDGAVKASDSTVLITTTEDTAVRDCEKTASLIKEKGVIDRYLVVNRVRPKDIRKGKLYNIDEIIDTVNIRLLGLIPEDPETLLLTHRGELAVGNKHTKEQSRALINIAKRITGVETPLYRFW